MALGLSTAHATLELRPGGMVYDSVQNITWLADANYAQTSGYDGDGFMTWDASITWADQLVYGGFSDWRLFNAAPDDTTCDSSYDPGGGYPTQYYGYNCNSIGNELAHLFYIDLGVAAGDSILTSTAPEFNFFTNVQSNGYWSGTEYAPNSDVAWSFDTNLGDQGYYYKAVEFYSWAVRTGDVAAVPEPALLFLLISGLLGIAGVRGRGRRL